MKYAVRRFKSPELALKELEPFVRDGHHLQTGKPFKRFDSMRSREVLANWLICAALNAGGRNGEFYFTSDPTGGDGIICNEEQGATWPTEHVLVPNRPKTSPQSVEAEVLESVRIKVEKGGAAYAAGKTLIVFLNSGGGEWHPNKVAKQLPQPLLFDTVWTVGLHSADAEGYVYGVSNLELNEGNAPCWLIRTSPAFDSWNVERVQ